MIGKHESTKVLVRLPVEMKSWLEEQAVKNWTSQNSEIIRAVRLRMNAEQMEKAAG